LIAVENIVFSVFTVLAGALLMISVIAYRRSGSGKMLMLCCVFTFFLAKGVIISASLWIDIFSMYMLLIIGSGLDALALILLYISTMRV